MDCKMKNLLMIAYQFPPQNSGGSHRPYRFAKYLKEFNINPVVITTQIDEDIQDDSLVENIENIKVIRTSIKKRVFFEKILQKQYFNILDPEHKKWKDYLFEAVDKVTKKIDFCAIYVTVPPFSIADIVIELSKKYNLPLILDMRDHFSYWNITPFPSYLHYKLILNKERNWFKNANFIIAVSEQMIEDFKKLHPLIDVNKYRVIKNSFENELKSIPNLIKLRKGTKDNPIVIGYVGSFYYEPYQREMIFKPWWKKKPYQWLQYTPKKEDWLYRSPYFFFKTISSFMQKYPTLKDLFRVEFVGKQPVWLKNMIKEFKLEDIVILKGFMPHKESLEFQKRCDALLGTSMKVIEGRDYCIAGKSYEYISNLKPILAFVTDGTQKDFFKESGLGVMFDPDNLDENVEVFKRFILGEIVLKPNKDFILNHNAKSSTKKLAKIVDEVCKK